MQHISYHASLASMPCLTEVEQLVDSQLLGDWIIRIQHTDQVSPCHMHWQQWHETLFAIQQASVVIEKLVACRTSFPAHAIRIYAEKYRPQVKFAYCVYSLDETRHARKHAITLRQ